MRRFFILFVVLTVIFLMVAASVPVQTHIVDPLTQVLAVASYALIKLTGATVSLQGNVLHGAPEATGIVVTSECSGLEACLILIAGMLAFPAPWRHKLLGILSGILAVQCVNIVRITSLFFIAQWKFDWFEFFHLYVWQAAIMLDVLIVFLIWLRYRPITPVQPIRDVSHSV